MLTPKISRVLLLVNLFSVIAAKHCDDDAQTEGLKCLPQGESVDEIRNCRCKSNCLIVMQRCTLEGDSYLWKYDNTTCSLQEFTRRSRTFDNFIVARRDGKYSFSCEPGFKLRENDLSGMCTNGLIKISKQPHCDAVLCSSDDIPNTVSCKKPSNSSMQHGKKLKCTCNSNYKSVEIICTSGTWEMPDVGPCIATNFILIISITGVLALLLLACIIGTACFVRTKVQKKHLENELKQMTLFELRRVMATPPPSSTSVSPSPQLKRPIHEKTDSTQLEYDYVINPEPIMERIAMNELTVPQSTKSKTKNIPPIHKTESISRYGNVKSRKRDEVDTTENNTENVDYDEIEDDEHEYATINEVQAPRRTTPKPVEYMNYK